MKQTLYFIIFLSLSLTALAYQTSSENYNLSLIVIDSGGTLTSSSNYNITLAVNQIAYTNTSSENYNIHFGIFPSIINSISQAIQEQIQQPTGIGGGVSPTLAEIIEKQKEGINLCGVFIEPEIILLNKSKPYENVIVRYTNPYVLFINSSFVTLGDLLDAVPFIEKNHEYGVMYEKLNITVNLKQDSTFKSRRFAALVLNLEFCGDYVIPIQIDEQITIGQKFTIQNTRNYLIELWLKILAFTKSFFS